MADLVIAVDGANVPVHLAPAPDAVLDAAALAALASKVSTTDLASTAAGKGPALMGMEGGGTLDDFVKGSGKRFADHAALAAYSPDATEDFLFLGQKTANADYPVAPTRYKRVGADPGHALSLQAADGSWWEIGDTVIDAAFMGVGPFQSAANNVTLLNALDAALSTQSAADGAWRAVRFGPGRTSFNAGLTKKNYVHWLGAARDATTLVYTGTSGNFLDLIGTNADRRKLSISGMTLLATAASNTAVAAELAYCIRAFELFDDVSINGFGDGGLVVGTGCFDSAFRNLELIGCGTNAGKSGIARKSGATGIAAITFLNLKAEICGSATSTGGAIAWDNGTTQGLYLEGMTRLQDNLGDYQAAFTGVDTLNIGDLYIEITSGTGGGVKAGGKACIANFKGVVRAGGAATGNVIVGDDGVTISCQCYPQANTGYNDFSLTNSSVLFYGPPPKKESAGNAVWSSSRITLDATSRAVPLGNEQPRALFKASDGTLYESKGVSSVAQQAVGRWRVTLEYAVADDFAAGCFAQALDVNAQMIPLTVCHVERVSSTTFDIYCEYPVNDITGTVSGAACTITPAQLAAAYGAYDPVNITFAISTDGR